MIVMIGVVTVIYLDLPRLCDRTTLDIKRTDFRNLPTEEVSYAACMLRPWLVCPLIPEPDPGKEKSFGPKRMEERGLCR